MEKVTIINKSKWYGKFLNAVPEYSKSKIQKIWLFSFRSKTTCKCLRSFASVWSKMGTFQISVWLYKSYRVQRATSSTLEGSFSSVSTNVMLAKLLIQNYEGTHIELLFYKATIVNVGSMKHIKNRYSLAAYSYVKWILTT